MTNSLPNRGKTGLFSILLIGSLALLSPDPANAWSKGGYRGYSGYGYSHHRRSHSSHRYRSNRSYSYRSSPRSCSRVSKTVRIDGRLRKVTGNRCYDSHGNPYIRRGSRRLGGYYAD